MFIHKYTYMKFIMIYSIGNLDIYKRIDAYIHICKR